MVKVQSAFSKTEDQKQSNGEQSTKELQLLLTEMDDQIKIQLKSPSSSSKVPSSICCVVDVSGSMSSLASIKSKDGQSELGYSIIDIVKHSINTIVDNLDENDHFSMITFSDTGNELFNIDSMNESNRGLAKTIINSQNPDGYTNLYSGIEKGFKSLQQNSNLNKHQSLIVLTDGQPNINPPRGVITSINDYYQNEFHDRKPSVNTFGFGYDLDSQMLLNIAQGCQGIYSFIPDSSFVGTVFTNSIAAMQSIYATNACLVFKPLHKDAKLDISQISSNFPTKQNNQGEVFVQMGNLQFGQTKDIIFSQKTKSQILKDYQVEIHYYKVDQNQKQKKFIQTSNRIEKADELEFTANKLRLEVIDVINQCDESSARTQKNVEFLAERIYSSKYFGNDYIKSLYEDINGQVKIAVSRDDYFQKWGRHYLPSLAMAHTHKLCTNFKDPGVQNYGGELFNKQRNVVEKIFMDTPPPKPTNANTNINITSATYSQTYYNRDNPCFDGNSDVLMEGGKTKKVKDIKKGDKIFCPNSGKSEVIKCVIETQIQGQELPMVKIGQGLTITPWHPIRIKGKWIYPSDLAQAKITKCSSVFSFLLESGHSMQINGIECVTFAHGFQEDIVKHSYFGTQKIVSDLKWMKGWWKGHIVLGSNPTFRDEKTDLVIKLRNNRNWMANIQDINQKIQLSLRRQQGGHLNIFNMLKLGKKLIKK